MKLAIVNSGVGNVRSVANMLRRIGVAGDVVDRPDMVLAADGIILPGVGSFDAAVRRFRDSGLMGALDAKATGGATPILGICLGMQLMGDRSEEGSEPGFGWIPGEIRRLHPTDGGAARLRVPHMGWNIVSGAGREPLYEGMAEEPRFYFDHSYHFVPRDAAHYCGTVQYGGDIAAGVRSGLLFGVQFHPEKSHRFGFHLLKNFVEIIARQRQAVRVSA